jgi:hypothetical protein
MATIVKRNQVEDTIDEATGEKLVSPYSGDLPYTSELPVIPEAKHSSGAKKAALKKLLKKKGVDDETAKALAESEKSNAMFAKSADAVQKQYNDASSASRAKANQLADAEVTGTRLQSPEETEEIGQWGNDMLQKQKKDVVINPRTGNNDSWVNEDPTKALQFSKLEGEVAGEKAQASKTPNLSKMASDAKQPEIDMAQAAASDAMATKAIDGVGVPDVGQNPADEPSPEYKLSEADEPSYGLSEPPMLSSASQPKQVASEVPPKQQSNGDDIKDLLARYNNAIAQRNAGDSQNKTWAAMNAFNYQKAGGNITAQDLYDGQSANASLDSFNKEMQLGDKFKQDGIDQDKRDISARGDDPNSEYSMATVRSYADSLGRPDLAEKLAGKVSANEVQKLFGGIAKPAMMESGKDSRLSQGLDARKDMTQMQIDAANGRTGQSIASREKIAGNMEQGRNARAGEHEKSVKERQAAALAAKKHVGSGKGPKTSIGDTEYTPDDPNYTPSKKRMEVLQEAVASNHEVNGHLQSMLDIIEKENPDALAAKWDSGAGAQLQTIMSNLRPVLSTAQKQGVLHEGDYKNFDRMMDDPAALKAEILGNPRLVTQIKTMMRLMDQHVEAAARGARVHKESDKSKLYEGWGAKAPQEQKQAQQTTAHGSSDPNATIEVTSPDGDVILVTPQKAAELKAEMPSLKFRKVR